jgi:hypothetical protein
MRRALAVFLSAAALTTVGMSAASAEDGGDPIDTTDLLRQPASTMRVGLDEPQCTGVSFVPSSTDQARADEIMSGYLTIPTFSRWKLPIDPNNPTLAEMKKLTWAENPFANSNWVAQFQMVRWADPLRREGLRTGNEAMLTLYTEILKDWQTNNPPSNPRSRFSWQDMVVGVRAVGLVCASTVYDETPAWLTKAETVHATALSDPAQYRKVGNHALHQNIGLLALGCKTGKAAWRDYAVSRANTLLSTSIDEEGVSDEGSILYQELNHRWYREFEARLVACHLEPSPLFARLDLMPRLLAQATQPDGNAVAFGDTSAIQPARFVPGTESEYAATQGAVGTRPSALFSVFTRGYAFSRTGWFDTQTANQQSLASMRFGPAKVTAVHGHEDGGNLGYFALGRQILWQPGVYGGGGGAARAYVLGNTAHNIIDVPSVDYNQKATTPLSVKRSNEDIDLVSVSSSVYPGAIWKRTMIHAKKANFLLVDDLVSQSSKRKVVQRWHLGADRSVSAGSGRIGTSGTGSNAAILWVGTQPTLSVVRGRLDPMLGWRSETVNQFIKSPTVEATRTASTVRLTTLIVPRASNVASTQIRVLRWWDHDGVRTVDVRTGTGSYRIAFTRSSATVRQLS